MPHAKTLSPPSPPSTLTPSDAASPPEEIPEREPADVAWERVKNAQQPHEFLTFLDHVPRLTLCLFRPQPVPPSQSPITDSGATSPDGSGIRAGTCRWNFQRPHAGGAPPVPTTSRVTRDGKVRSRDARTLAAPEPYPIAMIAQASR